jgi:hypothetical protein
LEARRHEVALERRRLATEELAIVRRSHPEQGEQVGLPLPQSRTPRRE